MFSVQVTAILAYSHSHCHCHRRYGSIQSNPLIILLVPFFFFQLPSVHPTASSLRTQIFLSTCSSLFLRLSVSPSLRLVAWNLCIASWALGTKRLERFLIFPCLSPSTIIHLRVLYYSSSSSLPSTTSTLVYCRLRHLLWRNSILSQPLLSASASSFPSPLGATCFATSTLPSSSQSSTLHALDALLRFVIHPPPHPHLSSQQLATRFCWAGFSSCKRIVLNFESGFSLITTHSHTILPLCITPPQYQHHRHNSDSISFPIAHSSHLFIGANLETLYS